MNDIFKVDISEKAKKELLKVPLNIQTKLRTWVTLVTLEGLSVARRMPGYHDEPLKGKRAGQRSIRLNRAYRAIYVTNQTKISIEIIEVNKHDY
jgi:proteic killer suppression protein